MIEQEKVQFNVEMAIIPAPACESDCDAIFPTILSRDTVVSTVTNVSSCLVPTVEMCAWAVKLIKLQFHICLLSLIQISSELNSNLGDDYYTIYLFW